MSIFSRKHESTTRQGFRIVDLLAPVLNTFNVLFSSQQGFGWQIRKQKHADLAPEDSQSLGIAAKPVSKT
jgi:hypothetical protein